MSVPLPRLPLKVSNIFLDPEERYEVYVVKVAERPQLLGVACDDDDDDETVFDPPLLDGNDIPAWRQEGLVPVSDDIKGVLRIGSGSHLFRRLGQWPTLSIKSSSPWQVLHNQLLLPPPPHVDVPRVDGREMAQKVNGKTRFAVEWEQRNVPVLIEHCTEGWKAMPTYEGGDDNDEEANFWNGGGKGGWTFENLLKRFGDISWRFSDTHGEMLSLATYAKYMVNPEGFTDDSPLAVYDSEFGEDTPTNALVEEYTVPPCFSNDLFALANTNTTRRRRRRPPYRWILMGPARSGTGLHIDPLWTNAWVTLLQGCKRWLLFPPDTPPDLIGMMDDEAQKIPSSIWFYRYYDKVTSHDFPYPPVHVLQRVGETVFVPSSWPHLVLNLELVVAVTHNYACEFGPFERMWKEVVTEEPEFAIDWFEGLMKHRPDLAQRIRESHPDTIPNYSSLL